MKNIRDQAKSGMAAKLSKFMGSKVSGKVAGQKVKAYASGGAVGAANMPGPVEGGMAKSRLDRPGRKMGKDGKSAGTNVNVIIMPKEGGASPMPMPPPGAMPGGPPGPPPGPSGPSMPPSGPPIPPQGPMAKGGRIGRAMGGKVHPDAAEDKKMISKMVHKHESSLHKGQKETKFKRGGSCK